jgi:hypothetical protein
MGRSGPVGGFVFVLGLLPGNEPIGLLGRSGPIGGFVFVLGLLPGNEPIGLIGLVPRVESSPCMRLRSAGVLARAN